MLQPPTASQWKQHEALITDLYVKEKMTQKEVAEYMRIHYNFHATDKMFVSRFLQWGINKKMKTADATAILQATRRRTGSGRKVLRIRLRGREVTAKEADISLRRRKPKGTAHPSPDMSAASTPSNISIICEDEDASEYAMELDDEKSGIVLADAAVKQRPSSPGLVGDTRLEVFFIRKLRDWREASEDDSIHKRCECGRYFEIGENPAFNQYLQDLRSLVLSPYSERN